MPHALLRDTFHCMRLAGLLLQPTCLCCCRWSGCRWMPSSSWGLTRRSASSGPPRPPRQARTPRAPDQMAALCAGSFPPTALMWVAQRPSQVLPLPAALWQTQPVSRTRASQDPQPLTAARSPQHQRPPPQELHTQPTIHSATASQTLAQMASSHTPPRCHLRAMLLRAHSCKAPQQAALPRELYGNQMPRQAAPLPMLHQGRGLRRCQALSSCWCSCCATMPPSVTGTFCRYAPPSGGLCRCGQCLEQSALQAARPLGALLQFRLWEVQGCCHLLDTASRNSETPNVAAGRLGLRYLPGAAAWNAVCAGLAGLRPRLLQASKAVGQRTGGSAVQAACLSCTQAGRHSVSRSSTPIAA